MIATGNWSVRELCKVVKAEGDVGIGQPVPPFLVNNWAPRGFVPPGWPPVSVHSVQGLVYFLYNVAKGNWAGPPERDPNQEPPRPLSFRGLLAGAAA